VRPTNACNKCARGCRIIAREIDVLAFIWINARKDRQRQGIGRQLTEHRIKEVVAADGRVIQLMTKDAGFFGRWFTVCRDYREEGWKLMTLQLGTVVL
jgi:GNAT superfamily N-acetyltransferase